MASAPPVASDSPSSRTRALKARALALLAQREHSRTEMRRKLAAHAHRMHRPSRDAAPTGASEPRRKMQASQTSPTSQTSKASQTSQASQASRASKASQNSQAPALSCDAGSQADVDVSDTPADAALIESVLDWLETNRYLSDVRFVESRVHARLDRFGNARIRWELAQHDAVLPPQVEQSLRESEFERARAVWARKFDRADAARPDAASRARQARFLAGRGFGAEVIARVLRAAAERSKAASAAHRED